MKFLNERIQLGFRNEKALLNERILSKNEFPIEILNENGQRINVYFTNTNDEEIFEEFITALSDYIINRYETKILRRILISNCVGIKPFQLNGILKNMSEIEKDAKLCRKTRKEIIKCGLLDYFNEYSVASVDGLVTFRLSEYEKILKRASDKLLDIYLTQREYEEFVELLKYFVGVQNNRPSVVHLIVHSEGMYSILNEKNEDITKDCIEDFVDADEVSKENYDDLLISILITLAPLRLVIHNESSIKNRELFNTLKSVFGPIEYCSGCMFCNTPVLEQRQ